MTLGIEVERFVRAIVQEGSCRHLTTLVIRFKAEIPTPIDLTDFSTLPNLCRLFLENVILVKSSPLSRSLTYLSLTCCNAISFSPLIESSPFLERLELIDSDWNGVPRPLAAQHQALRLLTVDNAKNLLNSSTTNSFRELCDFVQCFPNLGTLELGIPHWNEVEESEWNGRDLPLPDSLKSISFVGPTAPIASVFVEGLEKDRWPHLKKLTFGAGLEAGGEMQNCCSMSEEEIWKLERAVRKRGGIYLSVNEGRGEVHGDVEMTVQTRSEEPLFCHRSVKPLPSSQIALD